MYGVGAVSRVVPRSRASRNAGVGGACALRSEPARHRQPARVGADELAAHFTVHVVRVYLELSPIVRDAEGERLAAHGNSCPAMAEGRLGSLDTLIIDVVGARPKVDQERVLSVERDLERSERLQRGE